MNKSLIKDDIKDMNQLELLLNMFYVKDKEVWFRNWEEEMSVLDLVRKIAKSLGIDSHYGLDDETTIEILENDLVQSVDTKYGMIATFYVAMITVAEMREHIKEEE